MRIADPPTIKRSTLNLMTMALTMFDNIGETNAAVHLQHAIDVAEGNKPRQPGEDLPPELIERYLPSLSCD